MGGFWVILVNYYYILNFEVMKVCDDYFQMERVLNSDVRSYDRNVNH